MVALRKKSLRVRIPPRRKVVGVLAEQDEVFLFD